MQEYATAMLPKAIRTNCKYYGVNELGSENLPQHLSANFGGSTMAMECERMDVMKCGLEGQLANAMMKLYWHKNTPQPLWVNLDG